MSIINPWVFYAIDVFSNLGILAEAWLLLCGAVIVLLLVFGVFMFDIIDVATVLREHRKAVKNIIIITILSAILAVFVPSEEAMYQMLIAKYVTYDAVDALGEGLKTVVDYIVAAAKELMAQ